VPLLQLCGKLGLTAGKQRYETIPCFARARRWRGLDLLSRRGSPPGAATDISDSSSSAYALLRFAT
ncbi:MAG: hypothetical protein ACR2IK_22385, partial [Chloroflexota bacterium]